MARARLYLEGETLPDSRGVKAGPVGSSGTLGPVESWDQVEAFMRRLVPLLLRADAAVAAADQPAGWTSLSLDTANGLPHLDPSVQDRRVFASKADLLKNLAVHRMQDYVDKQVEKSRIFMSKFFRVPEDLFSKPAHPLWGERAKIDADLKAAGRDPVKLGPVLDSIWGRIRPFLAGRPFSAQSLGRSQSGPQPLMVTPHQYAAWRTFVSRDPQYLEHRDARAVALGRMTFKQFLADPRAHALSLRSLMDQVEAAGPTAPQGCAGQVAGKVVDMDAW